MLDPAAAARSTLDEPLAGESVGECSEGLIALERLDRQGVSGGAGDSADGAQRIPLSERRPDGGKPGVERPVMPVLDLLDSTAQGLEVSH